MRMTMYHEDATFAVTFFSHQPPVLSCPDSLQCCKLSEIVAFIPAAMATGTALTD